MGDLDGVAAPVEHLAGVALGGEQHVDVGQECLVRPLRGRGRPQLRSVVQVERDRRRSLAGDLEQRGGRLFERVRQRRRDAARVERVGVGDDSRGEFVGRRGRHRRLRSVVDHLGAARRAAMFEVVRPEPFLRRRIPRDPRADAVAPEFADDPPAERRVRELREPHRVEAEQRHRDRDVALGTPRLHVEAAGPFESLAARRREPKHRLAEGNEIRHTSGFDARVQKSVRFSRPKARGCDTPKYVAGPRETLCDVNRPTEQRVRWTRRGRRLCRA